MRPTSAIVLLLLGCATCFSQTIPATAPALVRVESAERVRDGTALKIYTLRNAHQMSVTISSHGATITGIQTPDRTGKVINVAWGGVTIGRFANRIAGASFSIDGKNYSIQANEGPNTLHSGDSNFADKNWQSKIVDVGEHAAAVEFTHVSKDGDGGFPGNLTAKITFTLSDDNALRLNYEATSDKATPLNMTNHVFFNLGGKGPVVNEEVWIDADKYTPFGEGKIPTGEIAPVKWTAFDFTTPTKIGARNDGAYDNNLVLNSGGKKLALAARVTDPTTGRSLEVQTDQPGLQLYTAGAPHTSVCFETQGFPDAVHHANFPSTILKPGETFKSTTIFTFSAN